MKGVLYWLLLCLICVSTASAKDATQEPLIVTYVGNTGYLVKCDGQKVAIDALLGGPESEYYDIPSDSVVVLMNAAQPPFDSINVIAVTHWHADHFTAGIVANYLKRNAACRLLCTQQVADKISGLPEYSAIRNQIRVIDAPVDSITEVTLDGITVKALSSKHGSYFETDSTGHSVDRHRNVQHLEFLFSMSGRSFLHVGDAGLQDRRQFLPLGLGNDSIDIAFVQRWACNEMPSFTEKLVRESVLPRRIFFTHLAPKAMATFSDYADCNSYNQVIAPLHSLQVWVIQ